MAAEQNQVAWSVGQTIVKDKKLMQTNAGLFTPRAEPNEAGEIKAEPFYKTFTITFHYLQQFHQLRVMKVMRPYDSPIYKIVLSSALKCNGWICWLKRQSKTWSLLLDNSIDEKLIATIGLAIEWHE
jgi:hypothetical protein